MVKQKVRANSHGANDDSETETAYPWGWGREFCRKDPDDPKRNRVLCPDCLTIEKVQRGTVRFVARKRGA